MANSCSFFEESLGTSVKGTQILIKPVLVSQYNTMYKKITNPNLNQHGTQTPGLGVMIGRCFLDS